MSSNWRPWSSDGRPAVGFARPHACTAPCDVCLLCNVALCHSNQLLLQRTQVHKASGKLQPLNCRCPSPPHGSGCCGAAMCPAMCNRNSTERWITRVPAIKLFILPSQQHICKSSPQRCTALRTTLIHPATAAAISAPSPPTAASKSQRASSPTGPKSPRPGLSRRMCVAAVGTIPGAQLWVAGATPTGSRLCPLRN